MRKTLLYAAVALMFAAISSSVKADDVVQPSWRGADGTTFQEWTFDTDANPAAPESITNAFGGSSADITVGLFGSGWQPQLDGLGTKTGFWDLGGSDGSMALSIPSSGGQTEVWLQITYFSDIMAIPTISIPGATRIGGQSQVVESIDTGGSWTVDQSVWSFDGGSNLGITLTGDADWGSIVDSVVVDTKTASTVPEPSSLSVLLLGGSGLLLRRRIAR